MTDESRLNTASSGRPEGASRGRNKRISIVAIEIMLDAKIHKTFNGRELRKKIETEYRAELLEARRTYSMTDYWHGRDIRRRMLQKIASHYKKKGKLNALNGINLGGFESDEDWLKNRPDLRHIYINLNSYPSKARELYWQAREGKLKNWKQVEKAIDKFISELFWPLPRGIPA